MRDYLPPMQALRSFEAAARLSSISKAAQELCVTQGAVSKQIKLLEAFLSVALFTRTTAGVMLTPQGEQYISVVIQSLNQLNSVGESLQTHPKKQQLLLDVIPSMSNIWFIPRIHQFEQHFSHLQIDLINGDGQPDFNKTQADICIRCLLQQDVPSNNIELFEERLVLVASPSLFNKEHLHTPQDILKFRLLQQNTRPQMWHAFFKQHKLESTEHLELGMGFQHFFMSLKAAEEGLGMALIPDFLAQDSIAQGKLINPLKLKMKSQYSYYIFSPRYKTQLTKVLQFNQWLLNELHPQ